MIKCSFQRNPYLCFITFEAKTQSIQSKGYLFSGLNTIICDFSSCDCTWLGEKSLQGRLYSLQCKMETLAKLRLHRIKIF